MRHLPITEAWNETVAFVGKEAALLLPVAFALIALPSILFQYGAPQPAPGTMPEPGAWVLFAIPVILLSLLGTLAITNLALRGGTTVGESISAAARRLLPVVGAVLLLGIVGMLVALPVILAASLFTGGDLTRMTAIATPVLFIVLIVLGVRMLFIYPVGAVEAAGPITIIKRTWTLTRGHFWRLFGFLVLILLVALVVSLAVTAMVGILVTLTIGSPLENGLSRVIVLLASGLLNTVVTVYLVTMIAKLYARVAAA